MITKRQWTDNLINMIMNYINRGWEPYLVTFMFHHLGGPSQSVNRQMEREVERVYATLLPRIVRKPRSDTTQGKLPVSLTCPDYPVPKHGKQDLAMVMINEGRHAHSIKLTPPQSRMKEDLGDHFAAHQDLYVRPAFPLSRIEAKRIHTNPEYVAKYAFKALERGRVDSDEVIVLPRSRTELPTRSGFID